MLKFSFLNEFNFFSTNFHFNMSRNFSDRNKDSVASILHGDSYGSAAKPYNKNTDQQKSYDYNQKRFDQAKQSANPQASKHQHEQGKNMHAHNQHADNPLHNFHNKAAEPKYPLSPEDEKRKKIAEENYDYIQKNPKNIPQLIDKNVETYYDDPPHINGAKSHKGVVLGRPLHQNTPILIQSLSTIGAAIESIKNNPKAKICILNFANAIKPGGGYLHGRNAQEETLCRQTLLYPTIDGNYMYKFNEGKEKEGTDAMIYSPNVLVIRDDNYTFIDDKYFNFRVNVITSPAIDLRKGKPANYNEKMKQRIAKIIKLAAFKGNDILILGAFGCGVFVNDPKEVSQFFKEVLIDNNLRNYFSAVIFPISQNSANFKPFQSALCS